MRHWLPEQLETVKCDCCGSTETIAGFTRTDGLSVVQCAQCSLAFLSPRPRAELIPLFYDQDYFTGEAAARGDGGLDPVPEEAAAVATDPARPDPQAVQVFVKLAGELRDQRVLEIGCATGELLLQFKQRGARTKGVELSAYAAEVSRRRGLDVFNGTVEEFAANQPERFDAVMAFEVIEHVISPAAFLAAASKLLRPDGLLLLSTPNWACTRRYGKEWLGLRASFEHIYFFETRTLAALAAAQGLEAIYTESPKYLGGDLSRPPAGPRWKERLRTLAYFVTEVGVFKTLRAIADRESAVYYCGLGHTLLMGFRKK